MSKQIFINYRRDDSAPSAGRIRDAFTYAFGADRVFLDSESIEPGEAWPERFRMSLEQARYVVAVIGPDWSMVIMDK